MTNAFYVIIMKFVQEVGMEYFAQSVTIVTVGILALAFLSCFFGLRLFRIFSAIMAFFLTAIGICVMLRASVDMGVIVTTFAIVGVITAFLAYHLYHVSVFFICACIGYSIFAVFTGNIWICIAAGIVIGVVAVLFSAIVIILSTAIWGAMTIGFDGVSYLGIDELFIKIVVIAVLVVAGIFVQYTMNKSLSPFSDKPWRTGRHAAK